MQNIKRFQKSLDKNGFIFTIFLLIKIIYQEVKRIPREYILQEFARKKFLKNNILFPNYMKNHKIKKTNIFYERKWKKGLPNYIDYLDQNNLINQIYKLKPKTVLEIGSGYSTYAIIHALLNLNNSNGHQFKFYCLDQTEEYLKELKDQMPEMYKKNIIFIHRKIYVDKFKNQKMSFFDNMPEENFDFIYEDRRDHPEAKIAGDIIKYENEFLSKEKSFSFTIDGMESTTNYYKKNLKYRYKYSSSYFHGINFHKL